MENTRNSSDSELIQASRSGDQAAFGQLVTRYQSLICSVAYNRCGDIGSSEDLAQEAFVQAWNKLNDLKEIASFKSWLCTIVRNLANRSYARQANKPISQAASLDSVAEVAELDENPATSISEAEHQQLVWNALSQIPENYREPMILFYREEQSVGRVAEALDLSSDAVKQRLSRGRKMLHAQMVATVEQTLSESKPSDNFANAVLISLGGGSKATIAGGFTKAASLFSGSSGMFWLSLAQLPLIVWLVQLAFKEARSDAERALLVRHLCVSGLGLLTMIAVMSAYIYFPPPFAKSLGGLGIPAIMVMYLIPVIWYSRRLSKRAEAFSENQEIVAAQIQPHGLTNKSLNVLFLGSGLVIALTTIPLPIYMGQWKQVSWMLLATFCWGLLARCLSGSTVKRCRIAYTLGMGLIALSCLGIYYSCVSEWRESLSNPSFWFLAGLQFQGIVFVLLLVYWFSVNCSFSESGVNL